MKTVTQLRIFDCRLYILGLYEYLFRYHIYELILQQIDTIRKLQLDEIKN